MFPFLTIFILFVLALNFNIRKQQRKREQAEERFWSREITSNSVRKQDISKLDYLSIPLEKIPQNLGTDSEKILVELSSCKLLNLIGQTNTDLKLAYGVANLDTLSEYESHFTRFVSVLPVYAKELVDSGQTACARELLELAVNWRADSTQIYTQLAQIYLEAHEYDRIQELIQSAKTLDSISGRVTVSKLTELLEQTK